MSRRSVQLASKLSSRVQRPTHKANLAGKECSIRYDSRMQVVSFDLREVSALAGYQADISMIYQKAPNTTGISLIRPNTSLIQSEFRISLIWLPVSA